MAKLPLESPDSTINEKRPRRLKLNPSNHALNHLHILGGNSKQQEEEDPIVTPVFSTPRFQSKSKVCLAKSSSQKQFCPKGALEGKIERKIMFDSQNAQAQVNGPLLNASHILHANTGDMPSHRITNTPLKPKVSSYRLSKCQRPLLSALNLSAHQSSPEERTPENHSRESYEKEIFRSKEKKASLEHEVRRNHSKPTLSQFKNRQSLGINHKITGEEKVRHKKQDASDGSRNGDENNRRGKHFTESPYHDSRSIGKDRCNPRHSISSSLKLEKSSRPTTCAPRIQVTNNIHSSQEKQMIDARLKSQLFTKSDVVLSADSWRCGTAENNNGYYQVGEGAAVLPSLDMDTVHFGECSEKASISPPRRYSEHCNRTTEAPRKILSTMSKLYKCKDQTKNRTKQRTSPHQNSIRSLGCSLATFGAYQIVASDRSLSVSSEDKASGDCRGESLRKSSDGSDSRDNYARDQGRSECKIGGLRERRSSHSVDEGGNDQAEDGIEMEASQGVAFPVNCGLSGVLKHSPLRNIPVSKPVEMSETPKTMSTKEHDSLQPGTNLRMSKKKNFACTDNLDGIRFDRVIGKDVSLRKTVGNRQEWLNTSGALDSSQDNVKGLAATKDDLKELRERSFRRARPPARVMVSPSDSSESELKAEDREKVDVVEQRSSSDIWSVDESDDFIHGPSSQIVEEGFGEDKDVLVELGSVPLSMELYQLDVDRGRTGQQKNIEEELRKSIRNVDNEESEVAQRDNLHMNDVRGVPETPKNEQKWAPGAITCRVLRVPARSVPGIGAMRSPETPKGRGED